MNKITIGILTAAMALSIGAAPSSGASPRNSDNLPGTSGGVCGFFGNACGYMDLDHDGICDNCGAYHFLAGFGYGCGYRFVDADGDGICDNYAAGCPAGGRGQGRGRGCRGGRNR